MVPMNIIKKRESDQYISFRFLATGLLSIVLLTVGALLGDTRINVSDVKAEINIIKEKKVDKDQYQIDIKHINDKLDELIRLHMRNTK